MQMMTDAAYEYMYKTAMDGISYGVAMRTIRKIMRDNSLDDEHKLHEITTIIRLHEKDLDKEEK